MKILFLTNLLPYPLDNGGKIKTYTTLQAMHDAGFEVDLVCFTENRDADKENKGDLPDICHSIKEIFLKLTTANYKCYMIRKAIRSLFTKYPFIIYKCFSREMKELIQSYQVNQYDCVYFAHLQMYAYAKVVRSLWPNAKLILDEQNCEAEIMRRSADNAHNFLKRKFICIEAKKLKAFETYAVKSANKTIVLSKQDKDGISNNGKIVFPCSIIPIGMNEPTVIKKIVDRGDSTQKILFIGTLTWAPNNEGIVWFIENVYRQLIEEKHFELYVVGKNPSEKLQKLSKEINGINLAGYVDNVEPYFEMCDFLVVPLFVGSGQRVKIIESFSRGMPVVSTSIGAEGLDCMDGKDILIANTKEAFVKKIHEMNDIGVRKSLSVNGRELFEKKYSAQAVKKKIIDAII